MNLSEFETRIQSTLNLSEKDSKRMDRSIHDIAASIGMESREVLDFIIFGAEKELRSLQESYDWEGFKKKISIRLRPEKSRIRDAN